MIRFSTLVLAAVFFVGTASVHAQDVADDASNVVAAYDLQAGELSAKALTDHRAIWSEVKALIPGSLLNLVTRLEFFQVPDPEAEIATDAYAVLGEDGATFTLGLNLDSARTAFVDKDPGALPEYQRTIIHELGHMVGFQASQMDQSGSVTGTLVIDEGTLKPGAYLNQFYQKFWKTQFPDRGATTGTDDEGMILYNAHPGSFVTEYAATGPLEDFAESFAWFVADAPTGSQVKDQKVRFFAAWPELVALKNAIRPAVKPRVGVP